MHAWGPFFFFFLGGGGSGLLKRYIDRKIRDIDEKKLFSTYILSRLHGQLVGRFIIQYETVRSLGRVHFNLSCMTSFMINNYSTFVGSTI